MYIEMGRKVRDWVSYERGKHKFPFGAKDAWRGDRSRLQSKSSVVAEAGRRTREKSKEERKKRKERKEKGRSGDKTGERKPVGKRVLSSWIGDGEGPRI